MSTAVLPGSALSPTRGSASRRESRSSDHETRREEEVMDLNQNLEKDEVTKSIDKAGEVEIVDLGKEK